MNKLIVIFALVVLAGCSTTSAKTHAKRGVSGIEIDCSGLERSAIDGALWGVRIETAGRRLQASDYQPRRIEPNRFSCSPPARPHRLCGGGQPTVAGPADLNLNSTTSGPSHAGQPIPIDVFGHLLYR